MARRARTARRTRLAVGAAVAVVGGIVAVGFAVASQREDSGREPRPLVSELRRDGSTVLRGRPGLLAIRNEPASYRIVSRVTTYGAGDEVVTRDEIAISRPFDGRTVKRDGPDADDDVRSEQRAVLGKLLVPRSGTTAAALLETGPSVAPSDLRIAPVLADLLAAGRVEAREWRVVADRPCQVLRFGGPITAGSVARVLDEGTEYADACVSEEGLVLEELWVESGRVQRWRRATSIEIPAADDRVSFPTEGLPDPVPVDEGGGSFRPLEPTSAYAAPFWEVPEAVVPTLGVRKGRWAVVGPAGTDPKDEETKQHRLGYVADVFVAGIDVVIVEQGSTAGGVRAFELGDGPRVTVDGLGEGELALDLRTSELRFVRDGGYFLKVRGTVSADRLVAIARSLRETPGGTGLTYLDAP
jgi:hypothetical protein